MAKGDFLSSYCKVVILFKNVVNMLIVWFYINKIKVLKIYVHIYIDTKENLENTQWTKKHTNSCLIPL